MGSAAPNLHGRGADVSVSSRTSTTGRDSLAEPTSAADSLPIASVTAASRPGASRARGHRGWLRLVSPIVVLALWQILSTTGVVSQQKLPSLTTLWSTAVHLTTTNSPTYGTLQHAMLISLERVAIGFVIGGGLAMILAIVAGSVDIGGVGDAPPVFAAAGEGKVAIVGARITPAAAGAIVVPKNSSITTIAQLKDKTIAAPEGTTADYHLLTVLDKAGLTKQQVTVDNLQPADALSAFKSGHVDAWDTWSPFIEEATNQDGARVLVNADGYGSPYSFQVASDAALDNKAKAAAIGDYEKILNEAYVWSATHTSTWAQLWGEATGLPNSTMLQAAKDDVNTPVQIDSTVINAEQKLATAFYKAGEIPTNVNMSKYMVTTFNDTVSSSSSGSSG
jgi:sulfonate transport system substrate-binding protein